MRSFIKRISVLFFAVLPLFALILFGCSKVHYGLSQGTYTMQFEEGTTDVVLLARPQITFDMETYTFTIASSYFGSGAFGIDDGYVTAKTNDGLYTYVFEIVDNDYIKFVQKKSTECGFADGALFKFRGSDAVELGEAFDGEVNTFEGMSMEVVQGTVYEDRATIEIENASGEHILGGNRYDYRIQVLVDGVWYELVSAPFANTDEAEMYDGKLSQGLNWFSRYGKLPAGTYRVVKEFFPSGNWGKRFLVPAEFVILEPLEDMEQKSEEKGATGAALVNEDDPHIIWADHLDVTYDTYMPSTEKGISVSYSLLQALENATDDDLFAVVVEQVPDTSYGNEAEYQSLTETKFQAEENLIEVAQRVVDELEQTLEISREEANARKYSSPEFLEARNAFIEAFGAVNEYRLNWNYDQNGATLDNLADLGFTIAYTSRDAVYHDYLYHFSCSIGVVIGTKEQIYALNAGEIGFLRLSMASKDAVDYKVEDWTIFAPRLDIHLSPDSKLTDELIAAYEENGGETLPVTVTIGYFGKRYATREADAIALNKLGFGNKESLYAYGTEEDEEEFIRETSRIFYHKDYNYDVITRLLREGELVQWDEFENYYYCNFYAELTYERALELAESKEIAYIELMSAKD